MPALFFWYNTSMEGMIINNQNHISHDETLHRINERMKKTVPQLIIQELTDPTWTAEMNELRKDYALNKKLKVKHKIATDRRILNIPPYTYFWIKENFGEDVFKDKKELKKVLRLDPLLEAVCIVPINEI